MNTATSLLTYLPFRNMGILRKIATPYHPAILPGILYKMSIFYNFLKLYFKNNITYKILFKVIN